MSTTRELVRRRSEAIYQSAMTRGRNAAADLLNSGNSMGAMFAATPDTRTNADQYKHARKGWSFASIRPIANRVAKQPLCMARLARTPQERRFNEWEKSTLPTWVKSASVMELTPILTHPLLDAIHRPNEIMVQHTLAWVTAASLEITGKAHWWFYDNKGTMQIWYIPSHWIYPDTTNGFRSAWRVKPDGGKESIIPGDQVAFFSIPDPSNPFGSCSPLGAAGRTILTDDALHESQYRGFLNGGMPTHAFIMGEQIRPDGTKSRPEITKPQREEMSQRLRQIYGGPEKHGKFIILDNLISDVKKISNTIQEMDYQASSRVTEREIGKIFGVNPIMMGEIENANRASAVVADDIFCDNVVNPLLDMMGQTLTEFVRDSSIFDDGDILAYYERSRAEDPEEKRKGYEFACQNGYASGNDYRIHVLGIPPIEGGDVARINAMLTEIPVGQSKVEHTARGLKRKTIQEVWAKSHAANERLLLEPLQTFFKHQASDLAKRIWDAGTTNVAFNIHDWTHKLIDVARPHIKRSAVFGAKAEEQLYKHSGYAVKYSNNVDVGIRQFLDTLFLQPYWVGIEDGVLDDLNRTLKESIQNGDNLQATSRKVEQVLGDASPARSMLIARSEVTGALNAGAWLQRKDSSLDGYVTGSEWSSVLDQATRGNHPHDKFNHVVMDGTRVAVDGEFDIQGEKAPYPGYYGLSAENRCNCRCAALSVTILTD